MLQILSGRRRSYRRSWIPWTKRTPALSTGQSPLISSHHTSRQGSAVLINSNADRPMSTILVVIDKVAVAADSNTFRFTTRGSWYTRWPLGTVQGQIQRIIPVASNARISGMHC